AAGQAGRVERPLTRKNETRSFSVDCAPERTCGCVNPIPKHHMEPPYPMSHPPPESPSPARRPRDHALAFGLCAVAAMLLLWPLFTGQILFGGARSDMYIAGYSFRLFGAQTFLETGSIPQWNPYLFGGLPYI